MFVSRFELYNFGFFLGVVVMMVRVGFIMSGVFGFLFFFGSLVVGMEEI